MRTVAAELLNGVLPAAATGIFAEVFNGALVAVLVETVVCRKLAEGMPVCGTTELAL